MPDEKKERIRYRVANIYNAALKYEAEASFWSDMPEHEVTQAAFETGRLALPGIPIAKCFVDIVDTFDDGGEITKYQYMIRDDQQSVVKRYESPDNPGDSEHVHIYSVPNDHKHAKRREHPRPDIEEVFNQAKNYST